MMLFASSFSDAIGIVQQYGPFCGCLLLAVIFFMIRDWKREERTGARLTSLEDEYRKVLMPMVVNCTEVIAKNSLIMERSTGVMERLERQLDSN